ncbi:MAG: aminotransferase class I/II-fold pyridoxal phosphate-dependent enzyme, partial [Anaerolineales bacterium]
AGTVILGVTAMFLGDLDQARQHLERIDALYEPAKHGDLAYQQGQEWLDQLLVYLQDNRDFLCETVNRELPGVSMVCPQGTYLAWLDCRASAANQEIDGQRDPYAFFLQRARVALNSGAMFGSGGEGFVRLNFACPRSLLAEALERMKSALLS